MSTGSMDIAGMACRYPGINSLETLWSRLADGQAHRAGTDQEGWGRHLPSPASSPADFGIPPLYRHAIDSLQLHLLEVAQEALRHAGAVDRERTDVILCTAFGMRRQYENHARVEAVGWAQALWATWWAASAAEVRARWKAKLDEAFCATSHDKLGEMASTLPARVAAHFKLRGRALTLESQGLGGLEALFAAHDALSLGHAQAVLVLGAQPLACQELVDQLLLTGHVARREVVEGACAIVLRAGGSMGPRALARIEGMDWFPAQARARLDRGADLHFCALDGIGEVESAAPHASQPAARAGGDTYAMQTLSAVMQCALVQHHRRLPAACAATPILPSTNLRTWALGSRYAIALAAAGEPARPAPHPPRAAVPVAVLGMGVHVGDACGLDAYWAALTSPGHRFRPLPVERFRNDLYQDLTGHSPISHSVDLASHCEAPLGTVGHGPFMPETIALASSAAREAFASLPTSLGGESGGILFVTASNLTTPPEKKLGGRTLLPRIEALFRELMEELAVPMPGQRRLLADLRERAQQSLAASAPPQPGDLCASGISRALAELLGETWGGKAPAEARFVAVEAACAGSLAALQIAVDSLSTGRCRMAVVAGVELPVNVGDLVMCASQRMLAQGLIASFADNASGFTPGDGAGVLVLARAEDAARWRQPVLARLLAVGSCTESKSLIAPNVPGQVKSMRRAFEQLGIVPAEIDFVETHGTGTPLGDEVEIESLSQVYGDRTAPLFLGFLKSRFGHCFSAAGALSIIKTVLALQRRALPPNHMNGPLKAGLGFDKLRFDPLLTHRAWPVRPGRPRRAAVNAFGTGGVNYHLLLEESDS